MGFDWTMTVTGRCICLYRKWTAAVYYVRLSLWAILTVVLMPMMYVHWKSLYSVDQIVCALVR